MFFLWILLAIILIVILLVYSTIKIEIKNIKVSLPKEERYINKEYQVIIKLYILKKIKILNLSITKTKLERKEISKKIQKIEQKIAKNKNNFDIKFFDIIKKLKIKIEKMQIKIYLGTADASVTAISIGIISSILGIILKNNAKFETVPIYQDKNLLKISLDGILKINMIHIIYIIYILIKKRRVEANVRTSNRRAYAHSDE